MENIIFKLISYSGEAKSFSMESISHAKAGNFKEAERCLELADKSLEEAHKEQTKLIQSEARDEKVEITLLMVHAQDHLMNAITVKDLAVEFMDMYKKILK
ncbi:MAG: PTS lactose/cellobiose transporter subunit IIA [Clostridium argentinense]|uniref:PTS lactose/cellobiose transporter subunit IIA n=2 Tax=Clostridium TaxID=1485 RepID=A0ABR8YPF6_9CLOT|nr:PTS lactose/cellobiose transporter subunit IIA [Clostridium faecium]MBD8046086.1 PTS lactose/cellobiose transporter subunit IIA [Clostridium faecium]MBS5824772.1 PTS lactose/cellobiose transporter subunit IIA [Clostridium argentinense]